MFVSLLLAKIIKLKNIKCFEIVNRKSKKKCQGRTATYASKFASEYVQNDPNISSCTDNSRYCLKLLYYSLTLFDLLNVILQCFWQPIFSVCIVSTNWIHKKWQHSPSNLRLVVTWKFNRTRSVASLHRTFLV